MSLNEYIQGAKIVHQCCLQMVIIYPMILLFISYAVYEKITELKIK